MIAGGKPAIAIGSFYSCAYPLRRKASKIAVISDARRGLIYLSCFNSGNGNLAKVGRERLVTLDEIIKIGKEYLLITYEPHLREKILSLNPQLNFYSKDIYPKAKYLMPLAELYYNKGKFTALDELKPLYLHPKTCQIRKKAG